MATKKTTRRSAASSASGSKKTKATKKATTKKASSSRSKKASAGKKAGSSRSGSSGGVPQNGPWRVEREIGGRTMSLETGRMAKLADGAIVARYGDTMVLATAQNGPTRTDIDFFPLTVDYREKAAAAGKFPGGFFKREGRPTTREILTCRIIDRSIRPLFAEGFRAETQVLSQVLSTDQENDSDTLAAVASYAALAVSSIPNTKTLGTCRIGLIDDELIINPTWSQLQNPDNKLNLTVSAHEDAVVMVEAGAKQVPEEDMLEALEVAHDVCREIAEMIDELVAMCGKPKQEVTPPETDDKLAAAIEKKFFGAMMDAVASGGSKAERGAAIKAVKDEIKEAFPAPKNATEAEAAKHDKFVGQIIGDLSKNAERESILEGVRADGRDHTTIRPITIEVGVLPRVHGSALFTRGETQALCVATLGTADDRQFMDGIYPEERKNWLLHYAFPPFSVGEVRRFMAPGRREIGHGALAERAVETVLPGTDKFPYSLRVTSEILESNGSSSMASVCGATLALMDAGVPLEQPVAGIAMGLVVDGKRIAILSDILGSEDHCGDMDFKVTGTAKGITALQMDIKCEGLARETLEDALEQAREGRVHLLREMLAVIRRPRDEISPNAPRLVSINVSPDKIGAIIGPAGRNIRGMQEEFEVRISVDDTGRVEVAGTNAAKTDACIERLRLMTEDLEIGKTYKGKVSGIKEFGAFIEIVPGQEGLCHVSELSNEFIRSVTDVVSMGEEIEVKVIDIDDFGKVKLSRRALLADSEGGESAPRRPRDDEDRPRGRGRGPDDDDRPRGRGPRRDGGDDRPRRDGGEDRPRRGPRREDRDDRPRGGRPPRDEDEDRGPRRPRNAGRDEVDVEVEERPSRGRGPRGRDRDDEDRSSRGRGPRGRDRDDEDRPPRGRGRPPRDDEDRPPRGRGRDDEDRPARGRGRDDEDRPARGRGRDDEDRPPRDRSRDDERPARGRGRDRDDDDRPARGRSRDDEDRPPRGRGRSRDDEDRPARGRGRVSRDDADYGETSASGGSDDEGRVRRRRRRPRD